MMPVVVSFMSDSGASIPFPDEPSLDFAPLPAGLFCAIRSHVTTFGSAAAWLGLTADCSAAVRARRLLMALQGSDLFACSVLKSMPNESVE
jgi:hypothetical protein